MFAVDKKVNIIFQWNQMVLRSKNSFNLAPTFYVTGDLNRHKQKCLPHSLRKENFCQIEIICKHARHYKILYKIIKLYRTISLTNHN